MMTILLYSRRFNYYLNLLRNLSNFLLIKNGNIYIFLLTLNSLFCRFEKCSWSFLLLVNWDKRKLLSNYLKSLPLLENDRLFKFNTKLYPFSIDTLIGIFNKTDKGHSHLMDPKILQQTLTGIRKTFVSSWRRIKEPVLSTFLFVILP